jgi:hypothetical protein
VKAYVEKVTWAPKGDIPAPYCNVAVANSGDFTPDFAPFVTNDGYYLFAATTKYGQGIYDGSNSYTTIAYAVHGNVVCVVRADRQGEAQARRSWAPC